MIRVLTLNSPYLRFIQRPQPANVILQGLSNYWIVDKQMLRILLQIFEISICATRSTNDSKDLESVSHVASNSNQSLNPQLLPRSDRLKYL